MLKEFSNKIGVSGLESEITQYSKNILLKYGDVQVSNLGNVICTIKSPKDNEPSVMLVAHMDEIGMIVTHIDDNGFIKIGKVGGIDRNTLMGAKVIIHGQQKVNGVVCTIGSHLENGNNKVLPKIDEIFIDTGYTKQQVEKNISLGDRITIDCTAVDLLNDQVSGKAMDDRSACVSFIKVCELLKDVQYSCGLSVVFSTMEEIGGQGAITAANIIKPTHAIIVDVSSAYTKDAKEYACGKMGGGPMIGYAPILDKEMSDCLVRLAQEKQIPYQYEIMSGNTGTDADGVVVCNDGIKTSVISIPIKYMHTKIETIAISDVENTAKLIVEYIKAI